MPRIFMHLRDHQTEVLDVEGIDVTQERVASLALEAARDVMCGDIRDGRLDLRYRIDVTDEAGRIVHSLAFADAISIAVA